MEEYVKKSASTNRKWKLITDLAFNAKYDIKIRACSLIQDSEEFVCGGWAAKLYNTGVGRKYFLLDFKIKYRRYYL